MRHAQTHPFNTRAPRPGSTGRVRRTLSLLAGVFGLLALFTALAGPDHQVAEAASEGRGCGYLETYGPFGAMAGVPADFPLALTICKPSDLAGDDEPEVDWGNGSWDESGVSIAGCDIGFLCRFYGRHTFSSPGTYTVRARYYQGAALYYTSQEITVYVYAQPPRSSIDPGNWMGAMRDQIGGLPLTQIVLPATHDSGSHNFSTSSLIAPDFPPIASQLRDLASSASGKESECPELVRSICRGVLGDFVAILNRVARGFDPGAQVGTISPEIGSFVASQADTQGGSIPHQLNAGVRMLDLRLCAPAGPFTEPMICHSLYGESISTVLGQILRFVQTHQDEVVIVELNRFVGLNGASTVEQHKAIITKIRQMFSTNPADPCENPATCLLVPASFEPQSTLNSILDTPGRVIVVDAMDSAADVRAWDAQQYPRNRVIWDADATISGEWIQTDDPADYRGYVFGDLDCRCETFSDDITPRTTTLFKLPTEMSPSDAWVTSTMVQRLLATRSPILAPALAKAILGGGYVAVDADTVNTHINALRAKMTHNLILNGVYDRVMRNPALRINLNAISTDWYLESRMFDIAMALNSMPVPFVEARAVATPASGEARLYQPGTWSRDPVSVTFYCMRLNAGSLVTEMGRSTVSADTAGEMVPSPGTCRNAEGVTALPITFGPVKIDRTVPAIQQVAPLLIDCTNPGTNGWCRGTVRAQFVSIDGASGLADPSQANLSRSTDANGAVVKILSGPVCDVVGNCNPGVEAGPFKIDSAPPTITVQSILSNGRPYTPGEDSQYPVTITFACGDATSGPVSATATAKVDTAGMDQSATGTCTDQAGNTASTIVSKINIPKLTPEQPAATPTPTPRPSATPKPSAAPTPTPTAQPTVTPKPAATPTPAATPSPQPIAAMTVSGVALVSGTPAAKQTVQAMVGAVICGQATTDGAGTFAVKVHSATLQAGCGTPGAIITFRISEKPAAGTVKFAPGETVNDVQLTQP